MRPKTLLMTALCTVLGNAAAANDLAITNQLKQKINSQAMAYLKTPCGGTYEASIEESITKTEDFRTFIKMFEGSIQQNKIRNPGMLFESQGNNRNMWHAHVKDDFTDQFDMVYMNSGGLHFYSCELKHN